MEIRGGDKFSHASFHVSHSPLEHAQTPLELVPSLNTPQIYHLKESTPIRCSGSLNSMILALDFVRTGPSRAPTPSDRLSSSSQRSLSGKSASNQREETPLTPSEAKGEAVSTEPQTNTSPDGEEASLPNPEGATPEKIAAAVPNEEVHDVPSEPKISGEEPNSSGAGSVAPTDDGDVEPPHISYAFLLPTSLLYSTTNHHTHIVQIQIEEDIVMVLKVTIEQEREDFPDTTPHPHPHSQSIQFQNMTCTLPIKQSFINSILLYSSSSEALQHWKRDSSIACGRLISSPDDSTSHVLKLSREPMRQKTPHHSIIMDQARSTPPTTLQDGLLHLPQVNLALSCPDQLTEHAAIVILWRSFQSLFSPQPLPDGVSA